MLCCAALCRIADTQLVKGVRVLGGAMVAVYILALAYYVVRSSVVSLCKQSSIANKFIYVMHLIVVRDLRAVSNV